MNRFHSQKLVEETDGLEKGRLNTKRRQTLLREKNISQILTEFESLTQAQKIDRLQFHLLEKGTLTKDNLSPEYFEVLPPLTEISTETMKNRDCTRVLRSNRKLRSSFHPCSV